VAGPKGQIACAQREFSNLRIGRRNGCLVVTRSLVFQTIGNLRDSHENAFKKRALDKIHKRRDRYEIPDWQRDEVWGNTQKQQLIDSILRG
jgi:hypothetical protein